MLLFLSIPEHTIASTILTSLFICLSLSYSISIFLSISYLVYSPLSLSLSFLHYMYLGLSLSQSLLSLCVSLFLAFSFSLESTNTRYTIPTNRSLCQLFEPFQWHSHTTFSQPHSPTCFTHFIQSLSLSFTKSIPTFLYTAIELFSRMWWRLILGPKW